MLWDELELLELEELGEHIDIYNDNSMLKIGQTVLVDKYGNNYID